MSTVAYEYAERPTPTFQIVPQQTARPKWHPTVGFVRWTVWNTAPGQMSRHWRNHHDTKRAYHLFQTCQLAFRGRRPTNGYPDMKEFPVVLLDGLGYHPCRICEWAADLVKATLERGG